MSRWPKVALGEVLTTTTRPEPIDATVEYRLLGVRLEGAGPFLRETRLGAQLSASSLSRVHAGDFIYSRLFAWRGAFGIVPPELDDCWVSNEFPTYRPVDDRVDPTYLNLWFRLPQVLDRVAADCTGSTPLTRNRYKERHLLKLEMPLPPVEEQRRAVRGLEQLAAGLGSHRMATQERDAAARALARSFFSGVTQSAPWVPLREAAPIVRRLVTPSRGATYPELGIRSFGRGTFHKPRIATEELGSKRLFRISAGDLVFNNVFAWEGAVAVADQTDDGRCGSHRFITCVPDPKRARSRFLCFYFLTPPGLEALGRASPGSAGRNRTLGIRKLEDIPVPLPPVRLQEQLESILRRLGRVEALERQVTASRDAALRSALNAAFSV